MALVSGPTLGDAIADPGNELAKLVAARGGRRQAGRRALPARPEPPATPAEIAACREDIAVDRGRPPQARRGARQARGRGRRWSVRSSNASALAAIAKAKADLAAYEAELAPKLAEQKQQKDADDRQARRRPEGLRGDASPASWPSGRRPSRRPSGGSRSIPSSLKASNGATLTKEPDGSIVASGKDGAGETTIVAETDLTGITGIRLEVSPTPGCRRRGRAAPATATSCSTSSRSPPPPRPTRRRPSRSCSRTRWPTSPRPDFDVKQLIDGNPQPVQGLGGLARHGPDPLGDLRDEGAHRGRRRDRADVQAAPQVQQRLDASAGSASR